MRKPGRIARRGDLVGAGSPDDRHKETIITIDESAGRVFLTAG